MAQDKSDLLELLRFELKFLEDGGYGRSPHTPWRRQFVFEDSPTCLNFGDPARPHPCSECLLMEFVPAELRDQASPCRLIPLTDKGETIDYFYRCGTQLELEEALAHWLRDQVSRIEEQNEQPSEVAQARRGSNELDGIRRKQWLAFAGNLYVLANRHRENQNYLVAHALYGRALKAVEHIATGDDDACSLAARIRKDQRAVFEMLHSEQESGEQALSEELQMAGHSS